MFESIVASSDPTGFVPVAELDELRKALEAGYGTDVSALTGGAALRIQSLDATMQAVIQENRHFRLFNKLPKPRASATVDEWTEQSGVGGFLGGSANTETGTIAEATGTFARRTGLAKYLMTRRQVSFVQTLQNAIAESEAIEYNNGALQLLTDAEYLCFEGDSAVVPTEFDGIYKQMVDLASADHILDAEASALNKIDLLSKAAAIISGYGNFGTPTDLFLSQLVQSDLDISLDPAFRVALENVPGGGVQLGAPVRGIRTSWGDIATQPDVFIRDEAQQVPFEVDFASVAAANNYAPVSVTCAAASNAASKFTSTHAGNYYYAVAGITKSGQSVVTKSSQQAVAAGEKCTLTITDSSAATETGYVIYRSRKGGTNATDDFRYVGKVAYGGATTTWVDYNREIPGTSKAYMLNLTPSATAITWRQFLPMLKFPLYPTASAIVPWAQLLFGYLRMSKRRHHVVIKNILPSGAVWRPFS